VPAAAEPVTPKKRTAFPVTIGLAALLVIIFAIFYFGRSKSSTPSTDTNQQPSTTAQAPAPQAAAPPPAKQNDPAGSVTHQVIPDVPQSAKDTITGTIKVVVQVQVDASGKVTSAKLKSPGSSKYFAGLALKAAPQWQFSPPEANGQPTASTWLVQFRFRRTGTQASAQRTKH
jgi:TonB family protein